MLLELIQKRRSIRKFLDRPVEEEKLAAIVEAALRAPSAKNLQPWEFIVVREPNLLEKLSQARSYGGFFLKNAALAIIVIADPKIHDTWIEDCSIASTFIQLAAESLGLGNCWVQIRDRMHDDEKTSEEYITELMHIPSGHKVESIIGLGYPREQKKPRGKDTLRYEKVHHNGYGTPYRDK